MSKTKMLFFTVIVLIIAACGKDEIPEIVIPTSFKTKLVVEKFTGEWCPGCVSAGTFYKDNKANGQFIPVAIHYGGPTQNDRYKDNEACYDMYRYLSRELKQTGVISTFFPNVMFNRTSNADGKIINGFSRQEWQTQFETQVAQKASCGLSIESSIVGDSLSGKVKYVLTEALPNSPAITVYVVENNLDGSEQESGGSDYMHHAVLRGLMTPTTGYDITDAVTNQILEFDFNTIDISQYKKADLEVIAFIHENGVEHTDLKIFNGQIVKAGATQAFD